MSFANQAYYFYFTVWEIFLINLWQSLLYTCRIFLYGIILQLAPQAFSKSFSAGG